MAFDSFDKFGLFFFLLIYIVIIGSVMAIFSSAETNDYTDSFGINAMQDEKTDTTSWNFLSVAQAFWGALITGLTIFWSILTLQIPYVPAWLGFILAIPVYLWIIVLIDYIIEFIPLAVSIYKEVRDTIMFWK